MKKYLLLLILLLICCSNSKSNDENVFFKQKESLTQTFQLVKYKTNLFYDANEITKYNREFIKWYFLLNNIEPLPVCPDFPDKFDPFFIKDYKRRNTINGGAKNSYSPIRFPVLRPFMFTWVMGESHLPANSQTSASN